MSELRKKAKKPEDECMKPIPAHMPVSWSHGHLYGRNGGSGSKAFTMDVGKQQIMGIKRPG